MVPICFVLTSTCIVGTQTRRVAGQGNSLWATPVAVILAMVAMGLTGVAVYYILHRRGVDRQRRAEVKSAEKILYTCVSTCAPAGDNVCTP